MALLKRLLRSFWKPLANKIDFRDRSFDSNTLSQGQQKRLALLNAYLEDKAIIVFDRWASDRDPEFKKIFYTQLLPELKARGKMVIAITHDDRYFHTCDRFFIAASDRTNPLFINRRKHMATQLDVVIIGAGFCGVTVAASLKKLGIERFVVIEKGDSVGTIWKNAYDRLTIHTPYFSLPFFPESKKYPVFKTKNHTIDYLTAYASHFQIDRHIRFNEEVQRIAKINYPPDFEFSWEIQTNKDTLQCKVLAICTGLTNQPIIPYFSGQQEYSGQITHSLGYKNGSTYQGQQVLVVGSGNSAAEIALDLYEHQAKTVDISIKGKRWVFPLYPRLRILQYWLFKALYFLQDCFNPSQAKLDSMEEIERMLSFSPEELKSETEAMDRWVKRFAIDLSEFSIYPEERGPMDIEVDRGRVAWVDRGTVKQIKNGNIQVIPSQIQMLTETGVRFENGETRDYDAIILATGFRPGIHTLLDRPDLYLNRGDRYLPKTDGKCRSLVDPTLYFVGFEKTLWRSSTYGHYGWLTGQRIATQLQKSPILKQLPAPIFSSLTP
jgi:indole-3-pyruvate monooxygenase